MAMWNTYVAVASADDTAEKVGAAGGKVLQGPFDVMDAGRMAVVADPEGAVFCIWEAKENIGAKVVNEHGALNFNGLATRDAAKAEAFYGEVFGWKLLSIPAGKFWMLPATATTSRRAHPACASRWPRWVRPTASSTSSPR